MSIQEMEVLKQHYLDEMKCLINSEYHDETKIAELKENFNDMSIEIRKKEKLLQLEQWANLSTYPSKRLNSFCYDEDYTIAVTPSLLPKEPDNSLSMGDEHLDTIPATESDEFIKSSVENLIPIPSESKGIPEHMCDVPFHDNSPPLAVSKDQFEDFFDSNDEFSLIDDDSFSIDNIDIVEASPPDSELVSSEVMEIVIPKVRMIDEDILLTIQDDILREKLLNVNRLIAKIKALNDNPTPSFDFMTKSSSTSLNSLLEETNTFDNSLPEFKTFCFDVEEISSGSTTTCSDISLSEYEVFYDDHVKEISSDSPTTYSDSSLYESFIFDLLIKPFPPADKSDFNEFTDDLIHFISPPEYDCFLFKIKPNSGDFTMDVVEDIFPTREPRVQHAFPTHDVPAREEFTTFSNILFDADYEFDSSDDQLFSDEDAPEKIFSNPLFEEEIIPMKIDQHPHNAESDLIESLRTHDSSLIISSKIDSFLDEFVGELTLLKSIPSRIDETDCDPEEDIRLIKKLLYDNSSPRPPKEFVSANSDVEIESFSPFPIPVKDSDSLMEEIDLSFTLDHPMPPGIEDDDYDSERDILILKDLPCNDTLSIPELESFHFDIPSFSHPPIKPPDGNTGILNVKMVGDISDQKVPMHKLMITLVPNQEKSPDLLYHRGLKTFQPSSKYSMMIRGKNHPILDVPLFYFYPP
nr:hypothetical protein [Tanacetum cinerariifolium]